MATSYKARVIELETIVENCAQFLELVPLEAISKGMTWYPSDIAVQWGRRAKDSVNAYVAAHLHGVSVNS